ncbi:MAG: site-specific integrase [Gammaproteobacteria bacterium]|jgi:integrase/recombinase XerD|nr:site-specific integrase [Gammaproteobacteria bacterium]MBT4588930.1 site-specific integrase [Rhodospirillaceae bacterium]
MVQATVLTDADIKKVLKIITIGNHTERNRIAFLLSVQAGMRVGEISKLTVGDVLKSDGEIVREIKLSAAQTKGSKSRIVYLSEKLQKELSVYIKTLPRTRPDFPLIYSQRRYAHFSNVSLCMLFGKIYEQAGLRNSSHAGRRTFATKLNAKGVGMRTIQKLMGHKHIGTTALYCDVSDDTLRSAVGLV